MSKAIIIGGGVIGLFSAYYLRKSGWEVEVLDKGDLSDNCSYGNAGYISPSHFVPLASPGMVGQGIRWMFNNKSPFYVKPALNRDLLDWGLKFARNCTQKHVDRSAGGLRDIMVLSHQLYHQFEKESGIDFCLEDKGIFVLFKTQKLADHERRLVEKATNLGLDAQYLSANETWSMEPGLEMDILGSVLYRCDSHIYPNMLMKGLIKHLEQMGVKLRRNQEVTAINRENGRISSLIAGGKEYNGDAFLIAGGSWSPAIAKLAGIKIPLMPGKGYSFMVHHPAKKMTIPAILGEARVAITPMNGSIRFGGTMEVRKINKEVSMNRVEGIVEAVPKYYPDFKLPMPDPKDIWFGFRPVSPDGLPYIGMSNKFKNLGIATGHAMVGLTMGTATGKLMAEAFNGDKPSMDIGIFGVDRYK
jgi:D-amino-acid dehydrogenase